MEIGNRNNQVFIEEIESQYMAISSLDLVERLLNEETSIEKSTLNICIILDRIGVSFAVSGETVIDSYIERHIRPPLMKIASALLSDKPSSTFLDLENFIRRFMSYAVENIELPEEEANDEYLKGNILVAFSEDEYEFQEMLCEYRGVQRFEQKPRRTRNWKPGYDLCSRVRNWNSVPKAISVRNEELIGFMDISYKEQGKEGDIMDRLFVESSYNPVPLPYIDEFCFEGPQGTSVSIRAKDEDNTQYVRVH